MGVAWPGDLPSCTDAWSEADVDVVLRTKNEAGPDKVRRRWTGILSDIDVKMVLTWPQIDKLRSFYRVDLRQGSLKFNFRDPTVNAVKEFAMQEPPQIANQGPVSAVVSMKWRRHGA